MDAPVVEIIKQKNVLVVRVVCCRLKREPQTHAFVKVLQDLMTGRQQPRIVINFTAVEFLSVVALGKLITLAGATKHVNGQLRVCAIRLEILEVFRITKLDKLFKIDDDLATSLVILDGETVPA